MLANVAVRHDAAYSGTPADPFVDRTRRNPLDRLGAGAPPCQAETAGGGPLAVHVR